MKDKIIELMRICEEFFPDGEATVRIRKENGHLISEIVVEKVLFSSTLGKIEDFKNTVEGIE